MGILHPGASGPAIDLYPVLTLPSTEVLESRLSTGSSCKHYHQVSDMPVCVPDLLLGFHMNLFYKCEHLGHEPSNATPRERT